MVTVVKGPGCQVDHSPQSNAEVKNEWIYASEKFYKIHPVVVYHIKIAIGMAVKPQQVLLILSTHATRFGRTDHIQAYKYIILKFKIKCIYTHKLQYVCILFCGLKSCI